MLTIDVLNLDCFIAVFKYLDLQSLVNVVTVNKDRYFSAAQFVFKTKFASDPTILGTSDESMVDDYLLRFKYFGDCITELNIKTSLPKLSLILTQINEHCKQSLKKLMFHYDDLGLLTSDDLTVASWFLERLDRFLHLRSLHCKYGDLNTECGDFHSLNVRMPRIPSLSTLIVDGFGGLLSPNLIHFLKLNPQIEEFSLFARNTDLDRHFPIFIADKLLRLRSLDIRFGDYLANGAPQPLHFENLERLRVVFSHDSPRNQFLFLGGMMNKVQDLHYTSVTASDTFITIIVSQFQQLKQLNISSYKLTDDQLIILAEHLENLECFKVTESLIDLDSSVSFTANGIKNFLLLRTELQRFIISLWTYSYGLNIELFSKIKDILQNTQWAIAVVEKNSTETQFVITSKSLRNVAGSN